MNFAVWVVPFVLCWIVALFYVNLLGLSVHRAALIDTILRIYRELGYTEIGVSNRGKTMLEYPNILTMLTSEEKHHGSHGYRALRAFSQALYPLLMLGPIFAQLFSAYQYARTDKVLNLMTASFFAAAVIMLIHLIIFVSWGLEGRSGDSAARRE